MTNSKRVLASTLVLILIVSTLALPIPVVAQPPGPPEGNEGIGNVSQYKATLRVYGENNFGPVNTDYNAWGQFVYPSYQDAFDPTALEKDVLVFNPALVKDGEYSSMFANTTFLDGQDIHIKKFLRLWYEPQHQYSSSKYIYPTIEVETTYMLVADDNVFTPVAGRPVSLFVFPIAEKANQTGLGKFWNEGIDDFETGANNVKLVEVTSANLSETFNKTTSGTIRIEHGYALQENQEVQFLDHKLMYLYTVTDPVTFYTYAKVRVSYAGNTVDDTAVNVLLGKSDNGALNNPLADTWFDRHNVRWITYKHPQRTWYARFAGAGGPGIAHITVGKRIQAGDTFYVNGVRYDVPAIEVIDTDGDYIGDAVKYITLRTPLPKDEDGTRQFPDDQIVSTQKLDAVAPEEVIPLNPPFNMDYFMIDDINVVLWDPGTIGLDDPFLERYLTMQEPPYVWTKIDNDMDGFWIAEDPTERVSLFKQPPLVFCYLEESTEDRFSTDLYEVLHEELLPPEATPSAPPAESWSWYNINTLPERYTAFALPTRWDVPTPPFNKTGDYLLVSSFYAPNSINLSDITRSSAMPRVAFAYDVEREDDVLGTGTLMGDELDIYVNSYGDYYSRLRIYGEDNLGPFGGYTLANDAYVYPWYEDPFNPAAIRKDSITFNPALISCEDYPQIAADGIDAAVKKYLRMWYEPAHNFSDDKLPAGSEPTIEVESTYALVDCTTLEPLPGGVEQGTFFTFPIASDFTTPPAGLDLFENPGSEPDRQDVVTLTYVNGSTLMYNKTTAGTIRIEKVYTLDQDEEIQFMDFKLKYKYYSEDPINGTKNATVDLTYVGNNQSTHPWSTLTNAQIDTTNTYFTAVHYTPSKTISHPYRTWYARYMGDIPGHNKAMIVVGKELEAGDIFYVEGVRYDVCAIEVIDYDGDTWGDKFKYITIKTPLPKGTGDFQERPPTSQWVDRIPPRMNLPLNPPFCWLHDVVDDIDAGITMPAPDRILEDIPPVEVIYISEVLEPRYSSNLLEILNETLYLGVEEPLEEWIKYEVITRPDQYTEFVLPADTARWDFNASTWKNGSWTLHNDYLVTTSFLAPNAVDSLYDRIYTTEFRVAFVYDVFNMKGIYVNEIDETPYGPPSTDPIVNLVVTPAAPTNLTGCEDIEVCTNGTSDDQWPLEIKVDWGDGTTSPSQFMTEAGKPVCFTYSYLQNGTYTITVTARDIYGKTGTKTHMVNVTSDCCRIVLENGWNQFSANVNTTANVSTIFNPAVYTWVDVIWGWDESIQNWDPLSPSDTLDPKRGYFVYCPLPGGDVIEIVGTAAPFDDSWLTYGNGWWHIIGVGYWDTSIYSKPYGKAYWWNGFGYPGSYDLKQTRGYWIKVP